MVDVDRITFFGFTEVGEKVFFFNAANRIIFFPELPGGVVINIFYGEKSDDFFNWGGTVDKDFIDLLAEDNFPEFRFFFACQNFVGELGFNG